MKMTLLEMVQSILSDMDAEEVNSIGDTTEATQVASIIKDTYYNTVANRTIPEHRQMSKLVALSDNRKPTHFKYADLTKVERVWYDKSDTNEFRYEEIKWLDPIDFVEHIDNVSGNYKLVDDAKAGTKLRIRTDAMPSVYTSFDDEFIVMDAYDSAIDSTLQESKTRAYGTVVKDFVMNDNFVAHVDAHIFPYLLAEAKSTAMSLLMGGPDPKVDQAARRQKSYLQNDKYNTLRTRRMSHYGR